MSKHTPGPWTGITGQTAQFGSIHTEDTRIATVEPDFTEETKANIRLIAAAPDLLAAMEELIDQVLSREPMVLDEVTRAWRTARTVVDKVRSGGGK